MQDYFSALILMGGEGRRLGSAVPKQFHALGPLKVYQHTLQTFRESGIFQEIILVCHADWVEEVQKEIACFPEVRVVKGGKTRQASSWEGLQACSSQCQYVMIHDAVRPFVSLEILQKNAEMVVHYRAVDTVIASADTLIVTEDGKTIASIPPRHEFRRGQTPQTFAYSLICKAHENTSHTHATDDCSLVLELGARVHLAEGSEANLKITTDWDLSLARFTLHPATL